MPNKRKSVRKNKTVNIVSKIIGLNLFIISLILFWMIFKINVIPTKYFLSGICIFTPVLAILEFFMIKNDIKKIIKIVSSVISLLIMIPFCFVIYYLYHTYDFLSEFKFRNYQTESFYVVVLKDDNYQKISDLNNETIIVLEEKYESYEKAMDELKEKVNSQYENSDNMRTTAYELLDGEINAVLLDDSYKQFLEDEVSNFKNDTKVIHTIEIKTKKEDIAKRVNVKEDSFNILISGIDTSGHITNVSRSDVNMVMTINPNTHQILLTSIPRDYYVQLHNTTGSRDKLTHSGTYGINMTVQTIEDLLDIEINYYIRVNFTTLIKLVDVIGGIDVYSDKGFIPWTNNAIYIPKGNVHMDGTMALAFARERYTYLEGDRHRIKNQQDVLEAVFKKITNASTLIGSYTNILNTLEGCFETNMDKKVITTLAKYQIDKMPSWSIEKISLNGRDSSNYTYSYPGQLLYVMEPDKDTVETASNKIKEVLENKK